MTSEKEFRNLEGTRFIEYCESSQRAITFSVDLYSSLVGKLISPTGLVGVPYFVETASTMSGAFLGQLGLIVRANSSLAKSLDTSKDTARELKELNAAS
jgi:hypothetical protein